VCAQPPTRWLDLGTGIGSVGLFLAWKFPQARGLGIEVQKLSMAMARRSFMWNDANHRVEIRHGDFRDASLFAGEAGIRRSELVRLGIYDVQPDAGTLMVRLGKGRKDRVVPIGERALSWIESIWSR
jgi:site-specific recombinase XerC